MPAGRTADRAPTWANGPLLEEAVWAHVRAEVAAGRQAYVVCPLIEECDKLEVGVGRGDVRAALAPGELAGLRLGLLHGRLPSAEKEAIMGAVPAPASSTCWWPRR